MIIFRYLAKELYSSLAATMLVLLLILTSNQFLNYLNRAAQGRYGARVVFELILLQVPFLSAYVLPLAFFLAIILAFGRLYADNEMVILHACGVSRKQLIKFTLLIGSTVAVIVATLMFWINPKLAWYGDYVLAKSIADSPLETVFPSRFITFGDGTWIFYTQGIARDHQSMNNVFVAQILPSNPNAKTKVTEPWSVVSASAGHQETNSDTGSKYIVLKDGYRYIGTPGQADYKVIKYDQYGIAIPKPTPSVRKELGSIPTTKLWEERNENLANAEIQWRLAMPLSVMVLALLAVPLSYVRPRQGRYANIFPAILVYIIYVDLIFLTQDWLQNGAIPRILGMWWLHGLMLVLAGLLLRKNVDWSQFFARFIFWKK